MGWVSSVTLTGVATGYSSKSGATRIANVLAPVKPQTGLALATEVARTCGDGNYVGEKSAGYLLHHLVGNGLRPLARDSARGSTEAGSSGWRGAIRARARPARMRRGDDFMYTKKGTAPATTAGTNWLAERDQLAHSMKL
ncbi:MAG: hypothetical protein V3V08_17755 [Nannocystaceae bacterium]